MAEQSDSRPFVIVGAGLAGGNAAVTLREEGFGGRVVLIGAEPGIPFGRPPLSKTYLRGEEDLDGWYVRPAEWFEEHRIERLAGTRVERVLTAANQVVLESGESLEYRKLLIATGGRNRSLGVPGEDLRGVHSLRTVAECDAIRRDAAPARHAVVVGMGFIGSEVAASLSQLGLRVTVVFPGAAPLDNVLGPEVGSVMAGIHREKGVELLTADQVVAFEGTDALEAVMTRNGRRLECDLAVVGVGIVPDMPAMDAVEVVSNRGVLVDQRCRTSVPDVYAAGDVASHLHPVFGRIRVEHYNNAERQGRAAARSMLGSDEPYSYIHSFWSDQYEHSLEYVGHAARWDRFVVRGSLEERRFLGFYLEQGVLRAAVGLNRGGDPELDEEEAELAACARLIAAAATPSPDALSDETVGLGSLTVH